MIISPDRLPSAAPCHGRLWRKARSAHLYRQSQILARSGVSIHRSTLADWVGVAGFHLRPVVDRLARHLKSSGKLFMPSRQIAAQSPAG
jgi:transposase